MRLGEGDFRRQMHRDKVCPLSGVTDGGRILEEGCQKAEAWSVPGRLALDS